jgi:dynactin 1
VTYITDPLRLSEQNQQLKEQITEKDSIIQDLENLKELNDELEIQHIEQANDLRMELEEKELALAEQADKFREQDAALADQEQLIAKFRDLVLDLQSRMDEAESMKTMTEEQAKDVEGRFNEVMELNRRLHNANLTSTTKTIMSELQKLRAEEANEELQIVKHYLSGSPEVYQNDSIRAYLCARRVSFKADLSGSLLRNLNMQATPPADADTFLQELFRLDTIQILTQLTLKSTRFSSAVSTSTLEQFEAFRPAFEELLPVEKTVERCLDAIKKDELNYKDTSATLRRSDIILGALNMDFSDALAERPEDETIQRVSSIKSNLELFKSCFDTAKTCVDVVEITEAEDEDPQEIRQRIARPSNHAAECIVVANKLIRTLITLRDDSLYPNFPQGIEDIVALDDFVAQAAQSALNFATDVCKFALPADDAEKSPIPAIVLSSSLNHIEDTHFGNGELTKLSDVAARLMFWNDYSSVLKNNIEIEHGPAPWVTKAKQMEDAKIPRAEAEEQFKKLAADHRVTILQLKERDEIIETKNLEIEHMRAKHREVSSELSELRKDQDEYRRLKEEYLHFKEEVEQKFEQMQRRQMEQALAEEHTGGSTAADAALPSKNDMATEKATAQAQMPTEHKAAVSAYRKENHWMRIRELARLFEQKLVDEPTKREEKEEEEKLREQDIRRDTMLDLSASISPPDSPVTPSTPPFEDEPPRLPPFHLLAKAGKIEPNPVLDALDDDLWFELADLRREIYVLNTKNMKV